MYGQRKQSRNSDDATASAVGDADKDVRVCPPRFLMRDFWGIPLLEYDVITVFGVRSIMLRLVEKIANERGSCGNQRSCMAAIGSRANEGLVDVSETATSVNFTDETAQTTKILRPLYIVCYRFPLPEVEGVWVKQLYAKDELYIYLFT